MKAALKYAGMILAGIMAALYAISRIRQTNIQVRAENTAIAILEDDADDLLDEANAATLKAKAAKQKAGQAKEKAEAALDRLAKADPTTEEMIDGWNKARIRGPTNPVPD